MPRPRRSQAVRLDAARFPHVADARPGDGARRSARGEGRRSILTGRRAARARSSVVGPRSVSPRPDAKGVVINYGEGVYKTGGRFTTKKKEWGGGTPSFRWGHNKNWGSFNTSA